MSDFPPNARHGDYVFRSTADKNSYGTHTLTKDRPQWLLDHPDDWKRFEESGAQPAPITPPAAVQKSGTSPSAPDYTAMQPYTANGFDLIPLGINRKFPTDDGWTKRAYSESEMSTARATGFNFGVRPKRDQLIIDVDIKNGAAGAASLTKLCADTGLDPATCPQVDTPSGGYHLYVRNIDRVDIPKINKVYPGIDFIGCESHQAVGAGSVVNGKMYRWNVAHPSLDAAPAISPAMVATLVVKEKKPSASKAKDGAPFTPEQIAKMLTGLDPTNFVYDEWLELLFSCHAASGGAALKEFQDWSALHPKFTGCRDTTEEKWASADGDKPDGITAGTLVHLVKEAGHADLIPNTDKRPQVILELFDLNGTIDKTIYALVTGDAPIYQRSGQIVHTYRRDDDKTEDGVKWPKGSLGIHVVSPMRLTQYAEKHVSFLQLNKKEELKRVPAHGFDYLSKQIDARKDQWRFRVLDSIAECPTIRDDGSLLAKPGYDPATRMFLDLGDLVVPAIPTEPTPSDAVAAMKVLTDALDEFPFVSDDENAPVGKLDIPCAARSVAISGIMTGIVQHGMDCVPLHGIDAGDVANGKSTLCDVIATVATGRDTPKITNPSSEEEAQKAWITVLMDGAPVVCIENVMKGDTIGGAVLARIVTEKRFTGRILGVNINADFPTNILILANGNNLTARDDLASRMIIGRIDSGLEHAGARTFKRDIRVWTRENRGALIAAALVVMRGFVVAGRPKRADFVPSRFTQWDNLVRGAICWAGQPDPWLTSAEVDDNDPGRTNLGGLLDAFEACFHDEWVGSKEIAARLTVNDEKARALQAALYGATGDKQSITAAIKVHIGKTVNERRFHRRMRSHVVQFQIENMGRLV